MHKHRQTELSMLLMNNLFFMTNDFKVSVKGDNIDFLSHCYVRKDKLYRADIIVRMKPSIGGGSQLHVQLKSQVVTTTRVVRVIPSNENSIEGYYISAMEELVKGVLAHKSEIVKGFNTNGQAVIRLLCYALYRQVDIVLAQEETKEKVLVIELHAKGQVKMLAIDYKQGIVINVENLKTLGVSEDRLLYALVDKFCSKVGVKIQGA